jgi:hypothetical protein
MQSRYNEPAYAEEVQRLKVVLASLREKYEVPG